jgi:hypothetical protein
MQLPWGRAVSQRLTINELRDVDPGATLTAYMKQAIAAVLVAAPMSVAFTWAAPVAHATGKCTDLSTTNPTAYQGCILNSGANCSSRISGILATHITCTYPDGGRDECDTQATPYGLGGPPTLNCQYIPPGA